MTPELELQKINAGFAALGKFNESFGFARLFRCVDGWCVSNKTDEGIGGGGPGLSIYGETPQETLFALTRFLEDPKVPAPVPCPKCGKDAPCDDFAVNSSNDGRFTEFMCPHCWEMIFVSEICPSCLGRLEDVEDAPKLDSTWEAKCAECGKIVLRGDGEEYPEFEMQPLDLTVKEDLDDE